MSDPKPRAELIAELVQGLEHVGDVHVQYLHGTVFGMIGALHPEKPELIPEHFRKTLERVKQLDFAAEEKAAKEIAGRFMDKLQEIP